MDRVILLALLGIPILVIIHVALFWQPIPSGDTMFWAATAGPRGENVRSQGHWRVSEPALRSPLVFRTSPEAGS